MVTPGHDANGNLTTLPRPEDPGRGFTAKYDAWNRMVRLAASDTGATVAEYAYDAGGRRAVKTAYTASSSSSSSSGGPGVPETRHVYYSAAGQDLEERVGSETATPDRQQVWGLGYVDELVLRDRATPAGMTPGSFGGGAGTTSLDERLYASRDAGNSVTAVVDRTGLVRERYDYAAYGTRTVYPPRRGRLLLVFFEPLLLVPSVRSSSSSPPAPRGGAVS